jgi:hypothetical protein
MISLAMTESSPPAKLESASYLMRGQRVMLDSDLAKIYGVTTMRLNEQLGRNRKRFPADFAFQLTREEFAALISQFAISKKGRAGRRTSPWVFTEHGAIMLASVLNSAVAIDASVRVVRAFVRLREIISANAEVAAKFAQLERQLDSHDEAIGQLFAAIRQLLAPAPAKKREIGFHVREKRARYRTKRKIS